MRLRYLFILIGVLAISLFASPVNAGGDVAVCNEANLLDALSGGGVVTFSCSGTITLSAPISIDTATTIDGTGEDVTISGGNSYKVLLVGAETTIKNLTISDGYGGSYTTGGGISNGDILTLEGVTFTGNSAAGGGAVSNGGELTVINSSFIDNAAFGNLGGRAAAIYNSNGDAIVHNSTFFSNDSNNAGAIYNNAGTLSVSNSTFMENTAIPGDGGAILNSSSGVITITNSTLTQNLAEGSQSGGGIHNSDGGSVTLENSIVADSQDGGNCYGMITDGGGNLSYPDATCPGLNLDPVLGPLQDNGGPTMTAALLQGSAAIDEAVDAICNAAPVNGLDQRGVARPVGDGCDIGAFETSATTTADFQLDVSPEYATICIPNDAIFDIDLTPVAGFDMPVTLSSTGQPSGTSTAFGTNPIIPPGGTVLTVTDTASAVPGVYSLNIVGDATIETHTETVTLELLPAAPAISPTLLTPPDGMTDTQTAPLFSWDEVERATDYTLEVATDSEFNSVVYSTTIQLVSHTPPTEFEPETPYFWRVTPENSCGVGPVSAVFTFTTGEDEPPTFENELYIPIVRKAE